MKKAIKILLLSFWVSQPIAANSIWEPIKELAIQADLSPDRKGQKELAKRALTLSESCLKDHPQEIGCHYYRAQARGIYHGRSFFGYVKRLRSMLKDWETVLALDPTFDYGGPYRMIAEVYMELPRHFGPKDLRQDLNKAIDYLKKAIAISDYPTNYIDLAEAYLVLEKKEEAKRALEKVKKILPNWKDYPYYASWEKSLRDQLGLTGISPSLRK